MEVCSILPTSGSGISGSRCAGYAPFRHIVGRRVARDKLWKCDATPRTRWHCSTASASMRSIYHTSHLSWLAKAHGCWNRSIFPQAANEQRRRRRPRMSASRVSRALTVASVICLSHHLVGLRSASMERTKGCRSPRSADILRQPFVLACLSTLPGP
jgi:hypothetical protein